VGAEVGLFVGTDVGDAIGRAVGSEVDVPVGAFVGLTVGAEVGLFVAGLTVGAEIGLCVGTCQVLPNLDRMESRPPSGFPRSHRHLVIIVASVNRYCNRPNRLLNVMLKNGFIRKTCFILGFRKKEHCV
jgi:hypothetical protein